VLWPSTGAGGSLAPKENNMAYVISDKMFQMLSDWMSGKAEIDLEEASEDLAAEARRVIEGLCYTREDWLSAIEDAGPDNMTEPELTWLWEQLDEIGFESSFVADAIKEGMEDQVEWLAQQIEQRREGAGNKTPEDEMKDGDHGGT
jgi:hypothetical protein